MWMSSMWTGPFLSPRPPHHLRGEEWAQPHIIPGTTPNFSPQSRHTPTDRCERGRCRFSPAARPCPAVGGVGGGSERFTGHLSSLSPEPPFPPRPPSPPTDPDAAVLAPLPRRLHRPLDAGAPVRVGGGVCGDAFKEVFIRFRDERRGPISEYHATICFLWSSILNSK